jgi:heme exporter protein C
MFSFLKPKLINYIDKKLLKPFILLFCLSTFLALYLAIFSSPPDYQQGQSVRIMYVHVPCSWMALFIYLFMSINAVSFLLWKNTLSFSIAKESCLIGLLFTFLSIATGSIWGRPTWGVWWVWDSRLTSMLILLFIYLGNIYLYSSVSRKSKIKAEKFFCLLAVIGLINLPIIKFSVDWWNTLHQPASIISSRGISIHILMLKPLMLMFVSFILYFTIVLIYLVKKNLLNKVLNNITRD